MMVKGVTKGSIDFLYGNFTNKSLKQIKIGRPAK